LNSSKLVAGSSCCPLYGRTLCDEKSIVRLRAIETCTMASSYRGIHSFVSTSCISNLGKAAYVHTLLQNSCPRCIIVGLRLHSAADPTFPQRLYVDDGPLPKVPGSNIVVKEAGEQTAVSSFHEQSLFVVVLTPHKWSGEDGDQVGDIACSSPSTTNEPTPMLKMRPQVHQLDKTPMLAYERGLGHCQWGRMWLWRTE
jgi:hypothetical protein